MVGVLHSSTGFRPGERGAMFPVENGKELEDVWCMGCELKFVGITYLRRRDLVACCRLVWCCRSQPLCLM